MNNFSKIGKEALEMLVLWEASDQATCELWTLMNGWVWDGFQTTYKVREAA
jgi:arginyl-tRNA synthetase